MPIGMRQAAERINALRPQLAEDITRRQYARRPELHNRYGASGRERCLEDANYHLSYLSEALQAGESKLFVHYVEWAREMLQARGIPAEDLRDNLEVLREALTTAAPEVSQHVNDYLDRAKAALATPTVATSFLTTTEPFADLAAGYLRAMLRTDRQGARKLILEALEDPRVSISDIYIHVFEKTQREIGRLWQLNQISVGQEHYCTAVTQVIMAELYPQIVKTSRNGRRAVIACVSGDLHELGARMVSDHLELEGWETVYLGANTPISSIIEAVRLHQPDIVAVSVAMTFHLDRIRQLIHHMRTESGLHARIIVGGYPFRLVPGLWRDIGADGFADDAAGAVKLADQLAAA
ncbi:MAG: cobalamin-dependent protein [Acidobacteriales bacterium]|nr:cobalamin-dependent protein [Terriglobales bacterium]